MREISDEIVRGELLDKRTRRNWWSIAQTWGVIFCSVAITLFVLVWHDSIRALGQYGYLGVFFISLMGNATIILPAPSLAAVFAIGAVLNPVTVGLVAGVGEALGEITGYLAGYGGRAVIHDRESFQRIEHWVRRYGVLVTFILSIIPNPFFDLAGIAAGIVRLPLWKFLLSCWAGKTLKALAFALAGAQSLGFISRILG